MSNLTKISVDFLELIKQGSHFTETRGQNVHIINTKTGQTEFILSKDCRAPTLVEKTLPDGSVLYVQEEVAPSITTVRDTYFSPLVIDEICTRIVQGEALTRICGSGNMPNYPTLCRWRREHPWVEQALDNARKDRAEVMRDKVMNEADNAVSHKDPITATQTRIDAYKWAAGVDSPEKYSPRAKIGDLVVAPTQIIIQTGIDRDVTPTVDTKQAAVEAIQEVKDGRN
jgi:hypothetical protein